MYDYIIFCHVIWCITIPTKKNLHLTWSQRKEKLQELENNAPIKRAHLVVLKELASEFLSSDVNGKLCYDTFFTKKKDVTHGSRRKFYNGILEEDKTKIKRKLYISTKAAMSSKGKSTDMKRCKVCIYIQWTMIMIHNVNNDFLVCWCILQDE